MKKLFLGFKILALTITLSFLTACQRSAFNETVEITGNVTTLSSQEVSGSLCGDLTVDFGKIKTKSLLGKTSTKETTRTYDVCTTVEVDSNGSFNGTLEFSNYISEAQGEFTISSLENLTLMTVPYPDPQAPPKQKRQNIYAGVVKDFKRQNSNYGEFLLELEFTLDFYDFIKDFSFQEIYDACNRNFQHNTTQLKCAENKWDPECVTYCGRKEVEDYDTENCVIECIKQGGIN